MDRGVPVQTGSSTRRCGGSGQGRSPMRALRRHDYSRYTTSAAPASGPPPRPADHGGSRPTRRCPTATGSPSSSEPGQPTAPTEAACDADAYRVVLGAQGEVLDVGRQTSRWPIAIRRAITVRDRGCTFPGCDRPPSWTDIHHCVPWSDDGKTSVDNGALLCRRHHTFVHQHHWHITIDNGKPTTRRPDGSPVHTSNDGNPMLRSVLSSFGLHAAASMNRHGVNTRYPATSGASIMGGGPQARPGRVSGRRGGSRDAPDSVV